jgi:hypothetical protein
VPERLALAEASGAMTLDFKKEDIYDRIQDLTAGRGADACIDAVGTEPDIGSGFDAVVDRLKVATFMGKDRPHVLRQAIHCCRFGTVSIVGVYGGLLDKIPMGSAINPGLTFRMAQTPVQHYLPQLLERIEKGEIDPSFAITHRATLEEGPELYKTFALAELSFGVLRELGRPDGAARSHQFAYQCGTYRRRQTRLGQPPKFAADDEIPAVGRHGMLEAGHQMNGLPPLDSGSASMT